jgi:hypothetical protein
MKDYDIKEDSQMSDEISKIFDLEQEETKETKELKEVKELIKLQSEKGITLEEAVKRIYLEEHGFEW